MTALQLVRVAYGKDDTPAELREYKLADFINSPVGCVSEWKLFAKKKSYDKLEIKEKDGSKRAVRC